MVKSVSFGFDSESARSHVHEPAGRAPQAQVLPATGTFSVAALSQVHWPAGRARQEHRAPLRVFSTGAFSQVHERADFWPHEQVACLAAMNGVSLHLRIGDILLRYEEVLLTYRRHTHRRRSYRSRWV